MKTHCGWFRWVICGLLFFATTINYIDRQVIAVLKPTLSEQFRWTEIDYSNIVFCFHLAYALGYLLAGRMMDWLGVRRGFALAVGLWSAAAMSHGLVRPLVDVGGPWLQTAFGGTLLGGLTATGLSVAGFGSARFALGLAEGGNFPGAIKTVGEWFPKRERALATGIFNAGSNVGAVITPLAVPLITLKWGWAAAFYATGGLGFVWLVCWLRVYRSPHNHPRVSAAELAYIVSDPPDPPARIPWLRLLRYRQTWAFVVGTFLTSPVWWFYLYWVPGFLYDEYQIDLQHVGPPLVVIYLLADVGSVGGGWLSSWLIQRGTTINFARKISFLACALGVVPVFLVPLMPWLASHTGWALSGVWPVACLIGLAAASHQGFSANLYTIVSDTVPRKAVSSVVGIGGMAGAVGGMLVAKAVGYILDWTHSYLVPFCIAAAAYPLALAIIQLLLPRLEPARFD
ncbi:MAG: MFS transporter [Thermoguttaceae bacterium]|jgi:ACS family hexuronate transporter-like MFS transporter